MNSREQLVFLVREKDQERGYVHRATPPRVVASCPELGPTTSIELQKPVSVPALTQSKVTILGMPK